MTDNQPALFGADAPPPAELPHNVHVPTFDEWWEKYPRKAGKQAARKRWARMDVIDRVLAWRCLPDWIEYARRTGTTKFVPHGSTFLNQARWEDESPLASLAPERKITTMPGRTGIERAMARSRESNQVHPSLGRRRELGDGT